jgi:peptidoglycan/LPS O-acetylase OafA/YrhL
LPASHHRPGRKARLALAAGGLGILVALAAIARYVAGLLGGARGTLAGIALAGVVFGACRLVFRERPRRIPSPPVPVPEREPAETLS